MKLQFLRSSNRIIGVALIFAKNGQVLHTVELPKPEPTFWRTCDLCTVNEAMVFCRDHTLYLCEFCLALHNNSRDFCSYISMTAARELITQHAKHEAHT